MDERNEALLNALERAWRQEKELENEWSKVYNDRVKLAQQCRKAGITDRQIDERRAS